MKENFSVMPESEAQSLVSGINNASSEIFCSFKVESMQDKIKLYNATNSEGVSLKQSINKKIKIVDVVVIPMTVKNEDGTESIVPRTTLIADDGTQYTAGSWGVYNSIKKINAIFGNLHFDEPITIVPIDVKTKSGSTINLRVV